MFFTDTFWVKNPLTSVYYQLNDKSALTWHQARKSCQQQGAELLSVSEPYEHTFLAGTVQPHCIKLFITPCPSPFYNRIELKKSIFKLRFSLSLQC